MIAQLQTSMPNWRVVGTFIGWPEHPGPAFFIAIVIFAFACLALCFQLVNCFRYARGANYVTAIRSRLCGSEDFEVVRQTVLDVFGSRFTQAKNVAAVFFQQAFRRGPAYETTAVVDSTLRQENESFSTAFTRWVIGTALIMGLAGTFVAFMQLVTGSGLLDALGALKDSAQHTGDETSLASSYGKLSSAFHTVYEGFGHAFLASLMGLTSTVILGFVHTLFLARKRQRCFLLLEEFGDEVLQPLLRPTYDAVPQLTDALRTASKVVEHSGDAVASLRDAATLLGAASESFKATQGANSKLITTLSDLALQLKTSREGWDVLLEALRESRISMNVTVEEFKKEAASQRQQTDVSTAAAVAGMRDAVGSLAVEIQKVSSAKFEQFANVQDDVRRMLENSKKAWEDTSVAILGQTGEAFKSSLATVTEVIEDSREDAAAARAELSTLTSRTAGAVEDHQKILEEHVKAVSASLEEWASSPKQMTPILKSLHGTLEKLDGCLSSVTAMPDRWEQRVLRPVADLSKKLDMAEARSNSRRRLSSRFRIVWAYLRNNYGAPDQT